LAVHALACDPDDDGRWYSDDLCRWHLDCQHRRRHPFTGAEPGGWGWTDLSGAVPDSDDTPAAILALEQMKRYAGKELCRRIEQARGTGVGWLLKLQNRDGGWPTFCRGWGKLPFDRSSTDLTAHAIRAIESWKTERSDARLGQPTDQPTDGPTDRPPNRRPDRAIARGHAFLRARQSDDGAWLPLWFGNQDRADESNPVYGTAKVLIAGGMSQSSERSAYEFLVGCQNEDGGWGGGPSVREKLRRRRDPAGNGGGVAPVVPENLVSSVEETALAVEALATVLLRARDRSGHAPRHQLERQNAEPHDHAADGKAHHPVHDPRYSLSLRGTPYSSSRCPTNRYPSLSAMRSCSASISGSTNSITAPEFTSMRWS